MVAALAPNFFVAMAIAPAGIALFVLFAGFIIPTVYLTSFNHGIMITYLDACYLTGFHTWLVDMGSLSVPFKVL